MHSQTLVILLNKRVPRAKTSDTLSTLAGKKTEQKYMKGQIANEKREGEKKREKVKTREKKRGAGAAFE